MLSRMPPKNTLESSRASSSLLWKCLRTFVYAFEPSPRKCEGEGSNEGFSAQYARSNLQSIYQLQTELQFYEKNKQEYLKLYPGQFVLIKGEQFAGAFTTDAQAYRAGLDKFGAHPFLIKQVLEDGTKVSYPALTVGAITIRS